MAISEESKKILEDKRFQGMTPAGSRIWLSSPTMHDGEQYWVDDAIRTNWVTTVGANINAVEDELKGFIGRKEAVGLADLPVSLNPIPDNVRPNYWLSCMIIDPDAMCYQKRTDSTAEYHTEPGKSCPTEILNALSAFNAEGRPIWKPMHMQPIYSAMPYVSAFDTDNGRDIFDRGLCLPSDNKMTEEEQQLVIDVIHRCFR